MFVHNGYINRAIKYVFLMEGRIHGDIMILSTKDRTGITIPCSMPSRSNRLLLYMLLKKRFANVQLYVNMAKGVWECAIYPSIITDKHTFYMDLYVGNQAVPIADFDIDLISRDATHIYCPPGIVKRVHDKRFSVIKASQTDTDFFRQLMRANMFVKQGWVMDDKHLGNRSWTIYKKTPYLAYPHTCLLCEDALFPHDAPDAHAVRYQFVHMHYECFVCHVSRLL